MQTIFSTIKEIGAPQMKYLNVSNVYQERPEELLKMIEPDSVITGALKTHLLFPRENH